MKEMMLSINNRRVRALCEKLHGVLWVHAEGQTFTYQPIKDKKKREIDLPYQNQICAPMPGKIVKVFKKKGDQVEKGQALLILEAMKMEYTLEAPVTGVLTKMNGHVGELVQHGQELAYVGSV